MSSELADLDRSQLPTRDDWLLERLLGSGHLRADDGEQLRQLGAQDGDPLPRLLFRLGLVPEKIIAEALAVYHRTEVIEQDNLPDEPVSGHEFAPRFLRGSEILPLWQRDGEMFVAMVDPADSAASDSIRTMCEMPVRVCTATRSVILDGIARLYGPADTEASAQVAGNRTRTHWQDRIADSPIARIVNDLIVKAAGDRASDIHLEHTTDGTRVRYRIDGVLHDLDNLAPETGVKACARVKLISHLDVAERRLPQDGRFQLDVDGQPIDIRVSSIPVSGGESIVLRILHRAHARISVEDLGFDGSVAGAIESCLRRSSGLLVVCGPTGSGKSTTLYSALETLNSPEKKLVTVEDPVEYALAGVNQIQVRPELGLTFAASLRSVLRQDPDIIMVGEIRDAETAEIGIQAALTGHLVLTTVHTRDAAASFVRLLDMGVESYLLASTVTGILAQRLVRRLCRSCRQPVDPDRQTIEWLRLNGIARQDGPVYQAAGCSHCAGTGYHGRTAVGEFIGVDEKLSQLIRSEPGADEIRRAAEENGAVPLMRDAARRVSLGDTTMEEVYRSVG